MEDIELVIKIDEETYKKCKWKNNGVVGLEWWERAIANGTPLPKEHGDLIDADRLKEEMERDVRRAMSFVDLTDFVYLAPTIIKADKEDRI